MGDLSGLSRFAGFDINQLLGFEDFGATQKSVGKFPLTGRQISCNDRASNGENISKSSGAFTCG